MSSHQLRRAARLFLALMATLQVAVSAGGPWLDAWFERRSRDVVAHVESSTADTCAALHDDDRCALCRELGRSRLNVEQSAALHPARDPSHGVAADSDEGRARPFLSLPESRAPPLA